MSTDGIVPATYVPAIRRCGCDRFGDGERRSVAAPTPPVNFKNKNFTALVVVHRPSEHGHLRAMIFVSTL